jgi:hypothetical protein
MHSVHFVLLMICQCQRLTGWMINDKLKGTQKEAPVLKFYPGNFPWGLSKNHKNSKILAKIWARQLPSMSLECQCHSNLLCHSVLLACIPSFDRDNYIWTINCYKIHTYKHRNNWAIYFETGATQIILLHFSLLKKC